VYTVKADGTKLRGFDLVQAIMGCLRLRSADEGEINFEHWSASERKMVPAKAPGYPGMMGKKIGLILQQELQTNNNTGADVKKLNIVVPFEAATGLVVSEILDGKTKAEKADTIVRLLKPVRDSRKSGSTAARPASAPAGGSAAFDDDIPF
jgi:hypothetical protein